MCLQQLVLTLADGYMRLRLLADYRFYVLVMTLMFSIYDHCMDCMNSYNCMALLWKPCFQVWPFYGYHVF